MKTIKLILKWLDGKKTIIGLGILALCGQEFFSNHIHVDLLAAMEWLGGILAGTGLVHKGLKTRNKPSKTD